METVLDVCKPEEFGLCGGQLSCYTCRVHFIKGYDRLPLPSEEEKDVFDQMGSEYRPDCTRMACELKVTKQLEGAELEVPYHE